MKERDTAVGKTNGGKAITAGKTHKFAYESTSPLTKRNLRVTEGYCKVVVQEQK